MPGEVFVSYSQPDRDCAFALVAHLETHGLSCWMAPRDVSPSADWAAEIIDAISSAKVMVLVFSAHSNESPQVRREVERAVHKRLRILPFRIEDVLPSKSLEYFLSAQHWLDAFPPPLEPHYAKLCSHLRSALSPELPVQPSSSSPLAPAASDARAPATGGQFPSTMLRDIEAELAVRIGPVARVLVKRAASRAASTEELLAQLAADLDSSGERQRFAECCLRLIGRRT
jgi:hypothetical protein